jgi:hypothetical protein
MGGLDYIPGSREFQLGERVRISQDHHWARGANATVIEPPEQMRRVYGDWSEVHREVPSLEGTIRCYWVRFDEAYRDADGHGPYQEGGIDSRFMEPLTTEG